MCKPVYAIDTPAGRIGIFEGDESEDFHGIRIFWIDENDAVIDLIAMIEGESANYLECKPFTCAGKMVNVIPPRSSIAPRPMMKLRCV